MGLLDKLKGVRSKGAKAVGEHEEKIDDAIDKAADFVDDKTANKHADKVDKAADAAKDAVEKLGDSS
jgi:hypothetical protein